jgi:hypothetical protein
MSNPLAVTKAQQNCLLQALNVRTRTYPDAVERLDDLAIAAGLLLMHARKAAEQLQDRGLIRFDRGANSVSITPAGVAEANRLDLPWWKRWATDREIVIRFCSAAGGAIVGGIVSGLFNLLK